MCAGTREDVVAFHFTYNAIAKLLITSNASCITTNAAVALHENNWNCYLIMIAVTSLGRAAHGPRPALMNGNISASAVPCTLLRYRVRVVPVMVVVGCYVKSQRDGEVGGARLGRFGRPGKSSSIGTSPPMEKPFDVTLVSQVSQPTRTDPSQPANHCAVGTRSYISVQWNTGIIDRRLWFQ